MVCFFWVFCNRLDAEKEQLPWWWVINREGRISLKSGQGYEVQQDLRENEGIEFWAGDRMNLDRYGWTPEF